MNSDPTGFLVDAPRPPRFRRGWTPPAAYGEGAAPVFLDVPALSDDAGEAVRAISRQLQAETSRQLFGPAPQAPSVFAVELAKVMDRVREGLLEKNAAYGNSALEPVRIFSQAGPLAQLDVRIDDKISRMKSGLPDDEDAAWDLLGYLVLREVAKGWVPA